MAQYVDTNISISYKTPEDAEAASSSQSASCELVSKLAAGGYTQSSPDLKIGDSAYVAVYAPAGFNVVEIITSDSNVKPGKSPSSATFEVVRELIKFTKFQIEEGKESEFKNEASLPKPNSGMAMPSIEWLGGNSLPVVLSTDGGSLVSTKPGLAFALVSYSYSGKIYTIPPISEASIYTTVNSDGKTETHASLDVYFILSKTG